MASTREIKERISSIQNTLKITSAMYMISSTKLNNARRSLAATEPYYIALQAMFDRVLRHLPEEFYHPYLDTHNELEGKARRRAIICVTADKGLAGSYNHNVLKMAEEDFDPGRNDKLFVVGEVGRAYFQHKNVPVDEHFHYTAQKPTLGRARHIASRMLELYNNREVDDVFIIFTAMQGSMEMETRAVQLLPLTHLRRHGTFEMVADTVQEDFNIHPDVKRLLDTIVPDFVGGFIYRRWIPRTRAARSLSRNSPFSTTESGRRRSRRKSQRLRQARKPARGRKRKLHREEKRRKR